MAPYDYSKVQELQTPLTGRTIKEDGFTVNIADLIGKLSYTANSFGEVRTTEYNPIFEIQPQPGVSRLRDTVVPDSEFDNISVVNGEFVVDGTTTKLALYTRRRGIYTPGQLGVPGLRVRIEDPSAGTYEYGYGDGIGNRMALSWQNGTPYTVVESGGNRYYEKSRENWLDPLDGQGPSGASYDINGATFWMLFGWYGGLSVEFFLTIPDREKGDRTFLVDRSERQSITGVTIEQPNLPIFAEADGGKIYIGGRHYGVLGKYRPLYRITGNENVSKDVGTTFEPLVSMRVKSTAKWEGVPIGPSGMSILANGNAEFALYVDADLSGASFGSFTDIPATETALEVDTAATFGTTKGQRLFNDNVPGGSGVTSGQGTVDLPDLELPGDAILTLAARGIGSSTTVNGILRLREKW